MSHLSTEETAFLKDKAKQIRIDILKMITKPILVIREVLFPSLTF